MVATTTETTTITANGAGTVTTPSYTYEVKITATAGGSGGGKSSTTGRGDTHGGGGASGSLIIKTLSVSEKEPISYDVGSGGAASSGGDGVKGGNTEFTYNSITYQALAGGGGQDADGPVYGVGGTASAVTDGDTNTIGNDGKNGSGVGGGTSAGGVSVSGDAYGVGGNGSTSYLSQNNTAGGDGGLIFVFYMRVPEITVPSDRVAVKKVATIGGNKISLTEDTATAKSRLRAAIAHSSISLEDTDTKFMLGGMPLSLKKANNGNYVLHVYAIDDKTPTYSPEDFEQSTDPTMFRGVDVDVFKSTDGNRVLTFDRLENQDDLDDFGILNSNETISNAIMWLGTPLIVNNEDVLVVSTSDESNVDEFVTTYFMGFPFLVARQGSNYLLCVLFDDYNLGVEDL